MEEWIEALRNASLHQDISNVNTLILSYFIFDNSFFKAIIFY